MKVHLVDATFELFRAYYSPGRSLALGPDGRPVNAVRGLIDSMLSAIAVAFERRRAASTPAAEPARMTAATASTVAG